MKYQYMITCRHLLGAAQTGERLDARVNELLESGYQLADIKISLVAESDLKAAMRAKALEQEVET